MNGPENQKQDRAWQAAVNSIAAARDQLGENLSPARERGGSVLERGVGELRPNRQGHSEKIAPSNEKAAAPEGAKTESKPVSVTSGSNRLVLKIIIGLVALASICAAAFNWQSRRDEAASSPVTTSSLPKPIPSNLTSTDSRKANVEPLPSPPLVQGSRQGVALTASSDSTNPLPSATAQSIEQLSRQITKLEEAIDQLNTRQMRLDLGNTSLTEQLKAMQEQMTRDNAAIVDQFKAAQAELARDNAKMGDQLKVLQSQLERNNIAISDQTKSRQEQIKAAEPIPRPKPLRQTTILRAPTSSQAATQPPARGPNSSNTARPPQTNR